MIYTATTHTPVVKDIYAANDFTRFEISALYSVDNDDWVKYNNVSTGQTYNCRLEAFVARFIYSV